MPRSDHQSGQALLILVAVIGLGAASLFMSAMGSPRLDSAREQRTMAALQEAREALIGFAVTHGRLPRPAISASDGNENPAPCGSEAACTGLLPWTTLGVPRTDAWGKLLRYSVTPVYTSAPLQRTSAVATKTVLTRAGGGQIVYRAGNPDCTLGSPCEAAIVYSNGRNNFGINAAGILQSNGAQGNVDEAANNVATLNFMVRPATDDARVPGGPFDDLLVWIDPQQLYAPMAQARVLP